MRAGIVGRTGLIVLIVVPVLVAACSSDKKSTPSTSVATSAATTTSLVAVTSTSSTTTTSTTVAPSSTRASTSTSTSSTSSTSSTTSSTVPASTTSTTPPGAALGLREGGLGLASFGTDPDQVIDYVSGIVGRPDVDTGWIDPLSLGACSGTQVRRVSWHDLVLLFSDQSTVATGRRHFVSYSYGPPFADAIVPAGLRTSARISVGSTMAELHAAYPAVVVNPADESNAANFKIADGLRGFVTGTTDTDRITEFVGGFGCGD